MVNKGAIKVTNAQIDQLISNAHISKLCSRTLPPFSHALAQMVKKSFKGYTHALRRLSTQLLYHEVRYFYLVNVLFMSRTTEQKK